MTDSKAPAGESSGAFFDILRERQPDNDTGLYLWTHTHDWIEIGANRWPNGEWSPVFQCLICTDVISTEAELNEEARVVVTWDDHGGERHQREMTRRGAIDFTKDVALAHGVTIRVEAVTDNQ